MENEEDKATSCSVGEKMESMGETDLEEITFTPYCIPHASSSVYGRHRGLLCRMNSFELFFPYFCE